MQTTKKWQRYDAEQKQRLFVDMDGTLAVFHPVDCLETLYEKGYFANLEPQINVIDAVKMIADNPEVDVYILSAVLSDSKYAYDEKNAWLDQYLPEIDDSHRIFVPCGEDKKQYVPGGAKSDDVLLDDYTVNLNDWEPPAKGLKLLNGINGTNGTWQKNRISIERSADSLAKTITANILAHKPVTDDLPSQKISYERLAKIADAALEVAMEDPENVIAIDAAVDFTDDELDRWQLRGELDMQEKQPGM